MKIVLSGGGTLGSVSPLIAVWQQLKKIDTSSQCLFLGTYSGPEKSFLQQYPEIKFKAVPSGKFRRYFSVKNFIDPFFVLAGFFAGVFYLLKFRPRTIFSAGGFVSVPVIFAGKMLGIKIIIHQLDIKPTLSNLIVQKLADKITVTFEKSLNDFPKKKTILVGSVLRDEINQPACRQARQQTINNQQSTILFLGGGTGALSLNKLMQKTLPLLPKDIQIYHVTGKNKKNKIDLPNYHQFDLLTGDYYQKISQAGLIITRAGLATLMELSYLGKAAIIIPLPDTHQEQNALYFSEKQAAVCLNQKKLTPQFLFDQIKLLLSDQKKLNNLSRLIKTAVTHQGEKKIADIIYGFK